MRTSNVIAIPKAGSIAHVEENARSLDVVLTEKDLKEIDAGFPCTCTENTIGRMVNYYVSVETI